MNNVVVTTNFYKPKGKSKFDVVTTILIPAGSKKSAHLLKSRIESEARKGNYSFSVIKKKDCFCVKINSLFVPDYLIIYWASLSEKE